MMRLLQLEWSKLYPYKTGKIMIIAYYLILIAAAYGLSQFSVNVNGNNINLKDLGLFNAPLIWQVILLIASFLKIFLALIIINNISNEYSYKTIKQNLIDGLSKKEFVLSKLLTIFMLSLVSVIFMTGIIISIGNIYENQTPFGFQGSEYLVAYMVELLAFFSFCTLVSVLVRNSAFSFGIVIVWYIVEGIISSVEILIQTQMLGNKIQELEDNMITSYLPLNAIGKMVPLPKENIAEFGTGKSPQAFLFLDVPWQFVVVSFLYFLFFSFATYWLIRKRDL